MSDPLSHNPSEAGSRPPSGDPGKPESTSQPEADEEASKARSNGHGATNGVGGRDGGHTLAPKLPNLQESVEEILSRPPSRPSSPAMLVSSSRRTSQVHLERHTPPPLPPRGQIPMIPSAWIPSHPTVLTPFTTPPLPGTQVYFAKGAQCPPPPTPTPTCLALPLLPLLSTLRVCYY